MTEHRLTQFNLDARIATCAVCGVVRIESKGKRPRNGQQRWRCSRIKVTSTMTARGTGGRTPPATPPPRYPGSIRV
jgi:hypothetical protein